MKRSISIAVVLCAFSIVLNAQIWTEEGPSSRHSHTAVFDPTTGQMIIFGGQDTSSKTDLNDVWLGVTATSQDESFTQLLPTGTLPAGRYGHVATYDSVTNRMTIFGGAEGAPSPCGNDVWILEGANGSTGSSSWSQQTPSGTPPAARVYAAGAYDSTSDSMIVFGGNNCSTGYFNDVWVLSSANGEAGSPAWTQLVPSGTPPAARESASAVYDSAENTLTIYAGDAGGSPFGDVWVLSHANGTGGTPAWTKLSPTGTAPNTRTGQSAVYDSADNRMIIFGGQHLTTTLTDTWILTAPDGVGTPSWIELKPTGTAPSLAYHSAVYNSTSAYMYVFAGTSTANKLETNSHAFTLTGANGLAKVPSRWVLGGPAVRYGQTGFYDSVTNSFFVFAGQHAASNLNFNDYWQASAAIGSSNLKWTLLSTKSAPSARYGQAGQYDSVSNRLMVFGGSTGTCQNDYHVLEHANGQGGTLTWLALTPTGTAPSARALMGSAYDSTSNTLMVFGGWGCGKTYLNDVWILTNANDLATTPIWTQLTPAGTGPSPRESSTAIYDPNSNTLVIYGGDAGGTPFGDLWVLSSANGKGGTPTWTELFPLNNGPVARSGHTAVYDSVDNLMTIYGGYSGTAILGDVWILSGANGQAGSSTWTQGVSGEARRFHSSQYNFSSNEMISFGGTTSLDPLIPVADLDTLTDANGLQ